MTAEQLFPVVDPDIRRAPISVTFVEVEDEISESSKEADDTNQAEPSIVDQIMNGNGQILYGPLYNAQALQGYILLCCQVPHSAMYRKLMIFSDRPGVSVWTIWYPLFVPPIDLSVEIVQYTVGTAKVK